MRSRARRLVQLSLAANRARGRGSSIFEIVVAGRPSAGSWSRIAPPAPGARGSARSRAPRRAPGAHPGRRPGPPPADPSGTAPASAGRPKPLAQRVLGDERLQLGDEFVVAPEREVGVDPELDRCQSISSSRAIASGRSFVSEVREGGPSTAPARRGAAATRRPPGRERACFSPRPPGARSGGGRARRVGPGHVAGRSRGQHVLRKRLPKSRDVDPQRGGGILGESSPQSSSISRSTGTTSLGWRRRTAKRTRLEPAEGNLAAFFPHLERSQDPELHLPGLPAGTLTPVARLKRGSETPGAQPSRQEIRATGKRRSTMSRSTQSSKPDPGVPERQHKRQDGYSDESVRSPPGRA